MGYVTTREEYSVQSYEGGHTLFGQWEFSAFMMKFSELAAEMLKTPDQRNLDRITRPPIIRKENLDRRRFDPLVDYFEN